jgi:hypothetical protein
MVKNHNNVKEVEKEMKNPINVSSTAVHEGEKKDKKVISRRKCMPRWNNQYVSDPIRIVCCRMKIDCFCCLTIRTFLPYHLT